jgi:hypothetical protein
LPVTDRDGRILIVVAVAATATATATLSLPAIAVATLSAVGGNLATDAVRQWFPALEQRLGIRPLVGDNLLREALGETFEQALERLENNYRKTPQYKESSEQGFVDTVFASLRTGAQTLFSAAADAPNGSTQSFPLDDRAVENLSLSEALDEYLPDASDHLRSFVAHNLPLFWASSFIERLTKDQDVWRAFQMLEWRELHTAVEALPRQIAEEVRSQLGEKGPSAEWQTASKEAFEKVATQLEDEMSIRLDELNREVREQAAQTREHVSGEADRIIGAIQEGRPARAEVLAEQGRFIKEKTVGTLQVLGVAESAARSVADKVLSRQLPVEITDTSPGTVLLLRGPLGAGKTTIAEALLLRAIELAQDDPDAPIPVFLNASTIAMELKDRIVAQCSELGDPARQGVMAVLDGLDQADPRRAPELLAESMAIARTWPSTRVVITGRSDPLGTHGVPSYDIPELPKNEWVSLVREVAGRRTPTFQSTYPESVGEAFARPLFAILLGIWMREPAYDRPPTVAALARHLIERSLSRAGVDRPDLSACLRLLARRVIESGGRAAHLEQVPNGPVLRQALLDTGIVSIDQRSRVGFTLAIFTEWFAGQALLQDPNTLADADVNRIMRWRYAIVAAVAAADHEQAGLILTPLVRTAPAIAGWVIHSALHNERLVEQDGDGDPTEEWAKLIVNAMDSWRRAMGPLARVTTPSTEDGQPAAFGVRVIGSRLEYGWSRYPGRIVEYPNGPGSGGYRYWSESGFTAAPGDSPFEWLFTWGSVRARLEEFLKYALLRPPTPALQGEYDWHVAQLVAGWSPSGHHCDAVPLESLQQFLDLVADYDGARIGNRTISPRQVRDLVERHRERGAEAVENPWPCSDLNTGWIPSAWSPKRRLERLQQVCEAALEGYVVAVKRYFPSFQTQLGTYASMPVKLRGYLSVLSEERGVRTFRDTWYMEPRPRGEPNSVEWTQVDAPPPSDELWEAFLRSREAYRPGLPELLTVSGRVPGLEGSRPAMNLLATLLWRDLHAWEWVPDGGPDLSNANYQYDPVPDSIYWAQSGVQHDK